ncbi:hypothetical protein HK099_003238 [Clydaea vesicula]|uniref:Uncharacterized protein n=1 Tax=Clydaea vesicula TaxID=447962 RepID=A0AAD5U200_9FUNG|nr:hypothetical protein HK099_003238 [Clydaea vesicula]KAJ3397976.1 hypothetical protein HDU92_000078 [Lobulomyces angularis]
MLKNSRQLTQEELTEWESAFAPRPKVFDDRGITPSPPNREKSFTQYRIERETDAISKTPSPTPLPHFENRNQKPTSSKMERQFSSPTSSAEKNSSIIVNKKFSTQSLNQTRIPVPVNYDMDSSPTFKKSKSHINFTNGVNGSWHESDNVNSNFSKKNLVPLTSSSANTTLSPVPIINNSYHLPNNFSVMATDDNHLESDSGKENCNKLEYVNKDKSHFRRNSENVDHYNTQQNFNHNRRKSEMVLSNSSKNMSSLKNLASLKLGTQNIKTSSPFLARATSTSKQVMFNSTILESPKITQRIDPFEDFGNMTDDNNEVVLINKINSIEEKMSVLTKQHKDFRSILKNLVKSEQLKYLPSILKIQKVFRGYLVRKKLFEAKALKKHVEILKIKENTRIITLDMLLFDTRNLSKNLANKLLLDSDLEKVIKVQALFKTFLVRSRIRKYLIVNFSATKIQRSFRKYLIKKKNLVKLLQIRSIKQENEIRTLNLKVEKLTLMVEELLQKRI